MRVERTNQSPKSLHRAAERFQQWRRRRERGTPIPESLWRLAANLAVHYGLSKTASTLKLDYYKLKKRLQENSTPVGQTHGEQPAFLELAASALAAPGECLIDCKNSTGGRMRIHVKGVALSDLAALGRSFWGVE